MKVVRQQYVIQVLHIHVVKAKAVKQVLATKGLSQYWRKWLCTCSCLALRSRTPDLLSDDMWRERERRQWEDEQAEQAKPVGPVHYEELRQGGQ